MLGQLVVADESSSFGDVGEQVTLGAEFNHDESTVWALKNAQQGDDIRVLAGLVMERDLPPLEASLPGIQSGLGEGLHSIGSVGEDVDGLVDHSVGTNSEDRDKFQTSG